MTFYWFILLVHCICSLSWVIVLIPCIGSLSWFIVLILCIDSLYWFIVLVHCIGLGGWGRSPQGGPWFLVLVHCIGSLFVGKAKAIGSGVKSAFVPPNGATLAEEGTELLIIGTKPLLTIGSIYAASAPLW